LSRKVRNSSVHRVASASDWPPRATVGCSLDTAPAGRANRAALSQPAELHAAGTDASAIALDKFGQNGVLYKGLATLGGGATLAGIVLGAVAVFIIDRQLEKAAWFALAGAVFTFFGLIHAEDLGIAQSPMVSLSYACIAVMLYCFAKFAHVAPATQSELHGHGEMTGQPAE